MEETNLEVQSTNNKKIYKIIGIIRYIFVYMKTSEIQVK